MKTKMTEKKYKKLRGIWLKYSNLNRKLPKTMRKRKNQIQCKVSQIFLQKLRNSMPKEIGIECEICFFFL